MGCDGRAGTDSSVGIQPLKYSGGTWVEDIPAIRSHATYTLNSADKPEKNAYKILTDDPTEFFVLEYRNNQNAYERHLPESGLLIYRVHTDKNGSTEPVPEFYVFRKDGEIDQAGDLNEALFSDINGRNIFSAASNPYPLLVMATGRILQSPTLK